MTAPPIPASDFDYKSKNDLRVMYEWAGSTRKLANYLRDNGIPASETTINNWRARYDIPIVNQQYAVRFGEGEEDAPDAAAELLDYFRNRPAPSGVPSRVEILGKQYATELIGGDLQYPFHHEAAFEVFLGLAEKMQPEGVTLNGDTYDFHYLSHFRQDPRIRADMQADIDECRELLARLNVCAPGAKKRLTVGNHDLERFMNYLMEKCPPLMTLRPLMAFDAVLGLPEVGWELVKEGYWLIDKVLRVSHGTKVTNTMGGGSGQSAKKEMLQWGCSGVTGHTHRFGSFYRLDPISYRTWHEGACLCDQKKMRAAGVTTHKPYDACEDWHLGCVRVDYNPIGESFIITDIPIVESHGRTFAIWEDEEIAA